MNDEQHEVTAVTYTNGAGGWTIHRTYSDGAVRSEAMTKNTKMSGTDDHPPPRIEAIMDKVGDRIGAFLRAGALPQRLAACVAYRGNVAPRHVTVLVNSLRNLAIRAASYADQLEAPDSETDEREPWTGGSPSSSGNQAAHWVRWGLELSAEIARVRRLGVTS